MKNCRWIRAKTLIIYLLVIIIALVFIFFMKTEAHASQIFEAVQSSTNPDTQVRLNWTHADGALLYELERNDGTTSTIAAEINVNQTANYTSYVDNGTGGLGLTPATSYTYTLRAYSDTLKQNEIALLDFTASVTTAKMLKPSITSLKYNINTKEITLTWNSNSKAAIGSEIRRDNSSGPVMAVLNTADTGAVFMDAGIGSSAVQYVVVSTGLGGLTSEASLPATAVPVSIPSVNAVITNGTARITWGSFAPITQFNLERAKFNINTNTWGEWQLVNSQLSNGMTYADNTPASGGLYRYRLNARAEGDYIGFVMSQPVSKPAAPTNLEGVFLSKNQVNLKWANNADNYSKLRVERRIGNGAYTALATLDEFEQEYSDIYSFSAGSTYTYRVTAYESDTGFSPSNEITLMTAVPSVPTELGIIKESSTELRLSWKDNSNSEAGFCIERRDGTGEFVLLTGNIPYNNTTYLDTVEAGHTYTYRVYAQNPFGNSPYSNHVTVAGEVPILAPASLTVNTASPSQLDLTWSYSATAGCSTLIERKTGYDGAWKVINIVAPGTVKYTDWGLAANTQYFYRVRSVIGTSVYTLPYPNDNTGVGACTMLGNLQLTGTAVDSNRIMLSWNGNLGFDEIIIERKMAGGNFAVLATVGVSTTSWYDTTGLIHGAAYTYRIKAKNSSNESAYSSEITVLNLYLNAPSNLIASVGAENKIELTWTDNSQDETGFEIYRLVYGSGTYQLYATVDTNITRFIDENVVPGVQYNYMVRAFMTAGDLFSPYTVSAGAGIGLLTPPSDLKYVVLSSTQAYLTWKDNTTNESGFRLERKLPGESNWTQIAWLAPNTTQYTLTGLTPYVTYLYRVRAYTYAGNFDSYSNEIEVSTGLPAMPTNVKAEAVSATQVNISWTDNASNESGYKIERILVSGAIYPVAEVGANATRYTDKGLNPGTIYTYRVTALNKHGKVSSTGVKVTTWIKAAFKDVTYNISWAKDAIENLAGRGVLKGKSPNLFKPDDQITRAEFTSIIIRAFDLNTSTPIGTMADVRVGSWYYKEVMIAENLGIVFRDSSGQFYPDRAITREEIAVIIAKTMAAVEKPLAGYSNSVLEKFLDKNLISPSALSSVASVVGEGIISGRTAQSIAPKDTATRAEAALMLYKVIDR